MDYYCNKQYEIRRRINEGGVLWTTTNTYMGNVGYAHSKYHFIAFGHLTEEDAINEIRCDTTGNKSIILKGIFIV